MTFTTKKTFANLWKAACAFLAAMGAYVLLPPSCPEPARRMAFVFTLAALFWALEIIPLYATSLLVIILEIFLFRSDFRVFLNPFSNPVIFLFFGGFTLAAALHKHRLDAELARRLLSIFGKRSTMVVTGFMTTTAFFSFWMSGTAATAMMLVLIQPLLVQIKTDDPLRKALVLAIPFGARIGGLCTPVGTPPNAIAVGILEKHGFHVSFMSWMAMGVPLALVILAVSSLMLFFLFKPHRSTISFTLAQETPIDKNGKMVFIIGGLTVFLWLSSSLHNIPEAVVALLAATFFFGTNLLDKNDLKRIDWDILILMWGGLALGEGMEISGFTAWIVQSPLFMQSGLALVTVLCLLAMGISTFMSNTAAANLLIPLVMSIPGENTALLGIAVALACSFDIPLPISSPPNALAFSTGAISVRDMLKAGIPIAIVAITLIIVGSQLALRTFISLN